MNNTHLSRTLFWDVNEKNINDILEHSREWVVNRVFEYGTIEEIDEIINLNGKEQCIQMMTQATQLKPVTKAMARLFLDLNLK
jgi:hypothetical protein